MATATFAANPQSSALAVLALTVNTTVTLAANPTSAAVASFALTGSTATFQASPTSSAIASLALTGSTATFAANPISAAKATFDITGRTATFGANPLSAAVASLSLTGATATFSARPLSFALASFNLTGASDSHGLSICDVLDEVLGMWGIFNRCSAPDFAIERAINDINTSMQTVWNHADERNYWSNSTLTLTIADTESSQNLPDNIQNVVGPCRVASTRRPLSPIGTIGELEAFADLYLDGETATDPVAYHIERLNQSGSDPAKTVFHITPPVDGASVDFLLEVVTEAPRYTVNDLRACPIIPIPHRYVESLLLPIARYQASSFYLFRKGDQKETIDREYQQARVSLGLADPLPGKSGDNKEGVVK